jgi:DNA-binding IclR family transcriptional regulator
MVAPDDNGRRVHAVETACRILEALHERDSDGGGVSELAADLGVSKATVHSHLATLQDNELVVKRGDRYHISLKFVDFGEHAKGTVDIYDIAISEVDQIAEETGEVAQFMIEEHGRGVYLHKGRGDKAIQTASYTGNRKALHCTALGKAILSELPRERVEEIIERYGLPAVTERTITDRDELFGELERIREENVAFDNEEVLQGLELEPHESSEILSFANQEVPYLQTPETSYFILGSYREPYVRRARIVQNELDKRLGTYTFLMGDLREIDIDRLPTFRIRFCLLATYADYIVGVYEQDAGGEITELGKISTTPYFEDSYVLPRDYAWMTDRNLETLEAAFAAAVNIYFNEDLDPDDVEDELGTTATEARRNGVDISTEDLFDLIEEREDTAEEAVSYSWVHLNEFRLFELHGRCFPWSDPDGLRDVVDQLP